MLAASSNVVTRLLLQEQLAPCHAAYASTVSDTTYQHLAQAKITYYTAMYPFYMIISVLILYLSNYSVPTTRFVSQLCTKYFNSETGSQPVQP